MPISHHKVGPGSLTFTTPAGTWSSQITSARVTPSSNHGDPVQVLSGEQVSGEVTFTAALEFSCLQDLDVNNGLVSWSWTNRGKEATFTYTPNTAAKGKISGKCIIEPIAVGGTVGENATSDVTFQCVDMPNFSVGT